MHHFMLSATLQEDVNRTEMSLLCGCMLVAIIFGSPAALNTLLHASGVKRSHHLSRLLATCDPCCMQINSLDLALANGTMLTITPQSQPHLWKAAQVSLSP